MSKYLVLYIVERSFIASLAVTVVRIMYVREGEEDDTIEISWLDNLEATFVVLLLLNVK